jgi:hypothetical protein
MCQVGIFTELAAGVGVGDGPLLGVGVGDGDGEAAFTPPQPAIASTAAAARVILILCRRTDGKEKEDCEAISNVNLTTYFISGTLSCKRKSAGNGQILRFV